MKIAIDRNEEWKEIRSLTIKAGDNKFTISVNKFDELVLNKSWGESGDSTIKIVPNVSNEIKII